MKIDYLLNGQPCNPVKREEIYLEVNNDQEAVIGEPAPHVSINQLQFAREDVKKIMDFINTSGLTQGMPFDIQITEKGVPTETINMYLDLMQGLQRSNNGITANVKMLQSLDWLDDKIDAFTFESMYYDTASPSFTLDGVYYSSFKDYFDKKKIFIPYVISTIPNGNDAFTTMFAMTFCIIEMYRAVKELEKTIAEFTADPFSWGGVAGLVVEIAFVVALIVTLLALIYQLITCLIQPLKYHAGMLLSDLLKITAYKVGLMESSSIYDTYPFNKIAILPQKYEPFSYDLSLGGLIKQAFSAKGITDVTSAKAKEAKGYPLQTGGDYLRLAKRLVNGKIIIDNGNLILERRDYSQNVTVPIQLPDIRQDWNGYNTSELDATIVLKFLKDLNEKNSIDKYKGTILQATHQQISGGDPLMNCLKGLREIQIPAGRGVRKETLTDVEKIFLELQLVYDIAQLAFTNLINGSIELINGLIDIANLLIDLLNLIVDVINDILGVINDAANLLGISKRPKVNGSAISGIKKISHISSIPQSDSSSKISNRIGALLLENDLVDVDKVVLIDTSRTEWTSNRIAYIHRDNQTIVNAQYLWDNFYSIDAFTGDNNNRYTKVTPALNSSGEVNKFILSLKDFKEIVKNNRFLDNFAEPIICDSLKWEIEKNGAAEIQYRKKGWLKDFQNQDGTKRSEEIAINLKLTVSLPDGQ